MLTPVQIDWEMLVEEKAQIVELYMSALMDIPGLSWDA